MQPSLGIMYALCFVAIAIAFAYAAYLIKWVRQQDPGNPQIVKVAGLIQSGANAFMRKEYTILAGFAGVAAVLILLFLPSPIWASATPLNNVKMAFAYICGKWFSMIIIC